MPKTNYAVNDVVRGFRTVAVTKIGAMNAQARQFEHIKSGARVIHVSCDDTENCFGICIPTPPPDNTGMPHILEHMTLAGSKKFPCKEPFFEMIKRSLATFINALTGSDMTYYPVSSNVHADLMNLADVYFDAVFHPLLTKSTFRREAHHLAPADENNPLGGLRIDGIVYSEMKGVFSDPESILQRHATCGLLPDTCHGYESGGDPKFIPDLTHEQLTQFHATRYHPSNAFFICYGDIPTDCHLQFLQQRLESFDRIPVPPTSSRQPLWSSPRSYIENYPVQLGESLTEKTYLALNWLTGDAANPAEAAQMSMISLLLLGNDGAPLKKAITDSHLGANLLLEGVGNCGLEATFHIAIDGSEAERLEQFKKVVFDTLETVAQKPFEPDEIKAAFQQTIYPCVEIDTQYPLNTLFRITSAWSANLEPTAFLDVARYYEELRRNLENDPLLLNRIIKQKLIDNPHRLDVTLIPSHTCEAENNKKLQEHLDKLRTSLSDGQMAEIANDAAKLAEENLRPNTPEDVAALPFLKIADIPQEPTFLPYEKEALTGGGAFLKVNKIPSNDIIYLTVSFDLAGLPEELWAYVPRFVSAISDFGTSGVDFAKAARLRSGATGSFGAAVSCSSAYVSPQRHVQTILFNLKTMPAYLDEALDLLEEAIFHLDPMDNARMNDVIIKDRAIIRANAVQNANATTRTHAARNISLPTYREHILAGLPNLALIEKLASDHAEAYKTSCDAMLCIQKFLLNRNRVNFALTAPQSANAIVRDRIDRWLGMMSESTIIEHPVPQDFLERRPARMEGLSAALQVAFSALALRAPHFSDSESIYLKIAASLITSDYLLPELRFKGNAYGTALSYSPRAQSLVFSSYRDPNIVQTFRIYEKAVDFVRNANWTQSDIDNAIISGLKSEERPFRPATTTMIALTEHLGGASREDQIQRRKRYLRATPLLVKETALRVLSEEMPFAAGCVAAGAEMLDKAAAELNGLSITPILGA